MQWWAAQNTSRPVWPGIATARIMSSEDPGRPASEIAAQVNYSRSLARTAPGQCFWSVKSIMRNAGGIQKYLNRLYPSMAVPPAMPWCGTGTPGQPQNFYVADNGSTVTLSWQPSGNPSRKWAVQARYGSQWATRILLPGQPDPRDAAQILPGGCRVRLRQGRQRLRSPGPRRGGQKVGSFFRQPPAGKEKNARCSKFFEQLQIHPCPNFHEFPWRGHEQKAFHRPFLIGRRWNNQPGPGNRAVYTTTAQDD